MNYDIDVRHVLDAVRVPTLLLYRAGEENARATRYMGERIRGAQIVELGGVEHLPWEGDEQELLDAIETFLAASPPPPPAERVFATILFTDIVGSTTRAVSLGDAAWRELLERHHAVVRADLERFRGTEVDAAGDGFLATFDGPARAVRCAAAIADDAALLGLDVRAGVHTGEIEVSGAAVRGIAVHTGARIAAAAGAREVLVSGTVRDLVSGSGLEFEDRGERELEGLPEALRLYALAR